METLVFPAIGSKVQRKGSEVVWTVIGHNNMGLPAGKTFGTPTVDLGIEGATEIVVQCVPKNRRSTMNEWLSIEKFNKNWSEVLT